MSESANERRLDPLVRPFDRCAEIKLLKDGAISIHCKRGLWSVYGRNKRQVEREAVRYWRQYKAAGEYDDLLANAGIEAPKRSGGRLE